MTNEANSPSASPAVLTRSQAEAEATAAHRARYLAKLTPQIVWFVLPILAICINLSLIIFREPTPADFTIAFVGLCLCAYSAITFYRDDQKIRAIAQLTPIYDMAALRAQVGVLNSTVALLRSEEHTSELQSLMRISSAVFCLKKKNKTRINKTSTATILNFTI